MPYINLALFEFADSDKPHSGSCPTFILCHDEEALRCRYENSNFDRITGESMSIVENISFAIEDFRSCLRTFAQTGVGICIGQNSAFSFTRKVGYIEALLTTSNHAMISFCISGFCPSALLLLGLEGENI